MQFQKRSFHFIEPCGEFGFIPAVYSVCNTEKQPPKKAKQNLCKEYEPQYEPFHSCPSFY
nr:MAG TPA: hypothetical protein [Caudoviricetes sp.]